MSDLDIHKQLQLEPDRTQFNRWRKPECRKVHQATESNVYLAKKNKKSDMVCPVLEDTQAGS